MTFCNSPGLTCVGTTSSTSAGTRALRFSIRFLTSCRVSSSWACDLDHFGQVRGQHGGRLDDGVVEHLGLRPLRIR